MGESSGRRFFCKGPDGNILGLAGRVVSEATSSAVITQRSQPQVSFSFKSHVVTEAIRYHNSLLVYNVKYAKCFRSKFKYYITVNSSHLTGKMCNPRTKSPIFLVVYSLTHSHLRAPTSTYLWVTSKQFLVWQVLPPKLSREAESKEERARAEKTPLTLNSIDPSYQMWTNDLLSPF